MAVPTWRRTHSGAIYCQRKGGTQNLLLQLHLQSTVRVREDSTPMSTKAGRRVILIWNSNSARYDTSFGIKNKLFTVQNEADTARQPYTRCSAFEVLSNSPHQIQFAHVLKYLFSEAPSSWCRVLSHSMSIVSWSLLSFTPGPVSVEEHFRVQAALFRVLNCRFLITPGT